MAKTPEGKIKDKVNDLLKKYGVWRVAPNAFYGRGGVPDILACAAGFFIGIECKRDAKHKMTQLQEMEAESIVRSGGMFFLVYDDATLDELEERLVFLIGKDLR